MRMRTRAAAHVAHGGGVQLRAASCPGSLDSRGGGRRPRGAAQQPFKNNVKGPVLTDLASLQFQRPPS